MVQPRIWSTMVSRPFSVYVTMIGKKTLPYPPFKPAWFARLMRTD
jgi:hypothetical protein